MNLTAKGRNGQLSYDGSWVTISRKGALAKMTQGLKGDKRIPVANITSVQFKPAKMGVAGFVQFSLLGSNESKSGLVGSGTDENSVMFGKGDQAAFEAIRDAVEAELTARMGKAGGGGGSMADELAKLAELRTSGVLTEDEFAAQKAKLLG